MAETNSRRTIAALSNTSNMSNSDKAGNSIAIITRSGYADEADHVEVGATRRGHIDHKGEWRLCDVDGQLLHLYDIYTGRSIS